MPIYRINYSRVVEVEEFASTTVEALNELEVRRKSIRLEKSKDLTWIRGEMLGVTERDSVKILSIEILADGDEKISPQPQD